MTKFTGLPEDYSAARDIYVQQEGAHVTLSVDGTVALITPSQARAISTELLKVAESADQWETDQ